VLVIFTLGLARQFCSAPSQAQLPPLRRARVAPENGAA